MRLRTEFACGGGGGAMRIFTKSIYEPWNGHENKGLKLKISPPGQKEKKVVGPRGGAGEPYSTVSLRKKILMATKAETAETKLLLRE